MMTTAKNNTLEPSGACKVLVPTVTAFRQEQLAALSPADRSLLTMLLGDSVEYVDHELFHRPDAQTLVFGRDEGLSKRKARFVDMVDPDDIASLPQVSTLTTAQEVLLFQRYNYSRLRIAGVIEAHAGRELSDEAIAELLNWLHRAMEARGQLAQSNMPLVLAMAKRTRLSSLDFNELISEGNFALLRSIEKFDCARGYKFSTYACRAILKSFSRVAMRTSRYRGQFPTEFDPALEKSDFTDRRRDDQEIDCVAEIRDILTRNRADLNEVERTVIRERFALDDVAASRPKTLEQVGALIGVTKERVRQIQNKALNKIKAVLEDTMAA